MRRKSSISGILPSIRSTQKPTLSIPRHRHLIFLLFVWFSHQHVNPNGGGIVDSHQKDFNDVKRQNQDSPPRVHYFNHYAFRFFARIRWIFFVFLLAQTKKKELSKICVCWTFSAAFCLYLGMSQMMSADSVDSQPTPFIRSLPCHCWNFYRVSSRKARTFFFKPLKRLWLELKAPSTHSTNTRLSKGAHQHRLADVNMDGLFTSTWKFN